MLTASPPGFGSHRPQSVGATKEDYVDWLIGVLSDIGEPVDLVGHDLGGLLALRVASVRGDLLRSWVSDGLSVLHPEYVWHRYARRWQEAATGTADIEALLSMAIEDRAVPYEAWGLSRTQAHELAGWFDETMGRAASHDPFVRPELAHTFGRPPAIHVQSLEGLGHWWMLEEPERSARVLEDFWASVQQA